MSCSNPISSVSEWISALPNPTHKMYEALCMEETAETMAAFTVTDGIERDQQKANFTNALLEYSSLLRQHGELQISIDDRHELLDGHLDCAWVHLCAALVILGKEPWRLQQAWARLHKANVEDKQIDGAFVLDAGGKVVKPAGWQPPNYDDLFPPVVETPEHIEIGPADIT